MSDNEAESLFDQVAAATSSKSPSSKKKKKSRSSSSNMTWADRAARLVPILLAIEEAIAKTIVFLTPFFEACQRFWDKSMVALEPYGPKQILGMAYGVSMMFFGGSYISTVAVLEAIDQGGKQQLLQSLRELHEQATSVREANAEDDQLDEDGDGIADVKQISKTELTMRKMSLFLRSCDPEKVSEAFGRLYQILAMVIATLQVRFARALSLGVSIGNVLSQTFLKAAGPIAKKLIDESYYPWIPVVTRYICRMIGVSIAFSVQRILSTVHTALNGARVATDAFTEWAEARGLNHLSDGYWDDAFAFVLAGIGIYTQIFLWSKLPFIIKLILFPATISEYVLTFLVSTSVASGTTTAGQQSSFAKAGPNGVPNMASMAGQL